MILLLGASGQLGSALATRLQGVITPSRAELDINDPLAVREAMAKWSPDLMVNCAAYTAVDAAEHDVAAAKSVNAGAVANLAEAAALGNARFVTFSSDYVFDGAAGRPYGESAETNPLNVYGRTKREGEIAALAAHSGALVVRSSWLVSATHPNFVATILRRLAEPNVVLRVVADQIGTPTVVSDLADATVAAIDARATGVLHLAGQGVGSWHDLAVEAAKLGGYDASRISPCTTEEYGVLAPRPRYSALVSERLDGLGVPQLPLWRESLPAVVARLTSA